MGTSFSETDSQRSVSLTSAVSCGLGFFPSLLLGLQGNFLISIARRELSNSKTGR